MPLIPPTFVPLPTLIGISDVTSHLSTSTGGTEMLGVGRGTWRGWVRLALVCSVITCVVSFNVTDYNDMLDMNNITLSAFELSIAVSETVNRVRLTADSISTLWMLQCGVCVFLMQMGFCFLEAGSVRSVSVINIIFKNLVDCSLGALMWWMTGYAFAFGKGSGFIGGEEAMFALSPKPGDALFGSMAHFFLSFTYMTASCTIVSGAVAERINLYAYCLFVVVTCGFTYPVVVHWGWSSTGFLSAFSEDRIWGNGLLDFAGSGVIHLFGGTSALCLAYLIGPRKLRDNIDLFSEEGQAIVSPHNKFQQAAGTLLLWFSWFMFNGGSVVNFNGAGSAVASQAIIATLMSSCGAGVFGVVISLIFLRYLDIGHACNSVLVGLVSITSACAYVEIAFSPLIGAVGVVFYFAIHKLRMRLRIDDVVDAGAVHFGGGLWGCIATGLFCNEEIMEAALEREVSGYGLFLGGGGTQLGVQLLYCAVVMAWCVLWSLGIYFFCKYTFGDRAHIDAEILGLDIHEHKAHSYDYMEKMGREREMAVTSVILAEKIASKLANFDLEGAEAVLNSVPHMRDFRDMFWQLLQNLRAYRRFLPRSLLEVNDDNDDECQIAPGTDGKAAIVFTDIKGSTASWEACPTDMREALRVHNRIIRKCIKTHNGYEVKTIGDAFMVAFATLQTATRFAIDVQKGLFESFDWPEALAMLPHCRDGDWYGILVRIGVNYGDVQFEMNPITTRCDYSGPTVNKASRLEAAAKGGAVAITEDAQELLLAECFYDTVDVEMDILKDVTLKGVPGAHTLALIFPNAERPKQTPIPHHKKSGASTLASFRSFKPGVPKMSLKGGSRRGSSVHPEQPGYDAQSQRETQRALKLTSGTVGQIYVNFEHEVSRSLMELTRRINSIIVRISNTSDRTEGSIHGINGNRITVTWNLSKRSRAHTTKAYIFAALLEEQHPPTAMSVALVSGNVLYGRIGPEDQLFVNALGQTLRLSETLLDAVRELRIFSLFGAMGDEATALLNNNSIRPIFKWSVNSETQPDQDRMTLYQLAPREDLKGHRDGSCDKDEDNRNDEWSWSSDYCAAFEAGDTDKILAYGGSDPIIGTVVGLMNGTITLQSEKWLQSGEVEIFM